MEFRPRHPASPPQRRLDSLQNRRRSAYVESTAGKAGHFDPNFNAVRRETVGKFVGPLHEREAGRFEILLGAELQELVIVLQAVDVEVVNVPGPVIVLAEDERRAENVAA